MRLVCLSDTHMTHRGLRLPEGDVLIHTGNAMVRPLGSWTRCTEVAFGQRHGVFGLIQGHRAP